MMPLNLELGMSASAASGAEAGRGDLVINSGGGKSNQTIWIVLGVTAVLIVLILFRRR